MDQQNEMVNPSTPEVAPDPLTPAPEAEIPATPAPEVPAEPEAPELPEPVVLYRDGITGFGFSQQGQSHIKRGTPCQDRCGLRILKNAPIVLTATADGVGRCQLSHYGAATAVSASLDYIQEELERWVQEPDFLFREDPRMGKLLKNAFRLALRQVEALAESMEQLPFLFQSTLTVSIYDGATQTLYYGHAGDDGIVVLCDDGTYTLATARHKGEESNSVYPLQSTETWSFGRYAKPVAAYVCVTDGVLDGFVTGANLNNRIYYPFLAEAVAHPLEGEVAVRELCRSWQDYLSGPEYRRKVRDDLTLVAVSNQTVLAKVPTPAFDPEEWEQALLRHREQVNRRLYPQEPPKATEAAIPASENADTPPQSTEKPPRNQPLPRKPQPTAVRYVRAFFLALAEECRHRPEEGENSPQ